jgi:hypothetical protein
MKTLLRRAVCLLSLIAFCLSVLSANALAAGLPRAQSDLYKNQIFRFNYSEQDCTATGAAGGPGMTDGSGVDRFLQVIAQQESGGNPAAANPHSSARGKYQYITSTWVGVTRANYPPAAAYSTADKAPEAYQDATAKIEYTKKFVAFKSDIFKLAVSHFYPAANEDPSMLDAQIGSNTITPRGYANSIIAKMNSGVGIGIGLHYTEAPEFAKYFGMISSAPGQAPVNTQVGDTTGTTEASSICGGNGSVAGTGCGDKTLQVPSGGTGVNVCNFKQSALAGGVYNWPGCGCLPTSILDIRATMENSPTLDHVAVLNGLKASGGVYSDGCSGVLGGGLSYLRSQGYQVNTILGRGGAVSDSVLAKIKDALGQGNLILTHTHVSVDSAGVNPTAGHFLVIYAVDDKGNFYVANPGSTADNGKPVTPARLKVWLDEFIAVKK